MRFSTHTIRLHFPRTAAGAASGRPTKTMKCRGCGGDVFRMAYIDVMPQGPGSPITYVACARPGCWRSYIVALHDGDLDPSARILG